MFAIARKALTDLATTSLEERLGAVFTRRLRELDGQAKAALAEALETASDPALVRSAFELPAEQRAAIQNALNETFSAEIRVRFETAPDLVSGIELTTSGQKVGWSIAGYLTSLEHGVDELLNKTDEVQGKDDARPSRNRGPRMKPRPRRPARPSPRPILKRSPRPIRKRNPRPGRRPRLRLRPSRALRPSWKTQTRTESQ